MLQKNGSEAAYCHADLATAGRIWDRPMAEVDQAVALVAPHSPRRTTPKVPVLNTAQIRF